MPEFFFSPKKPTSNGFIWGAGPIFLLNSATGNALGNEKWGIGPTGVILKQTGPWTYGMLANHIESFFGGGVRYWIDGPDAGPEGWGLRFQVTFLIPN